MLAPGETSWAEFDEEILSIRAVTRGPVARVERVASSSYPTPTRRPANSRLDSSRLFQAFGIILPQWQPSTRASVEQLVENKGWAS